MLYRKTTFHIRICNLLAIFCSSKYNLRSGFFFYHSLTKYLLLGNSSCLKSNGRKNQIFSKTYGYIRITKDGYVCPNNCGKLYKHSNTLYVHLKHECGRGKQFSCTLCGKTFVRRLMWKMHMGIVHKHIVE